MQDNTLRLRDGRVVGYSDYGGQDGVPILLFHGTPGSRILGLEEDPLLERFGIRIVAPERPGYGLSDPSPARTILDWADDVEQLADQLGLGLFHVAGESGGGPYALACAHRLPGRVLSVTLVGTACPPEVVRLTRDMSLGNRLGFFFIRHTPFLMKRACAEFATALRKHPEKVMRQLLSKFCEWDKRVVEQQGRRASLTLHFQEAVRQGGDGFYVDSMLVGLPWGFDYTKVEVPVFLWHGECDRQMPLAPARELAGILPRCEPHFLPEAGHLLLESDEMNREIVARLLSVSA
jgi:pimeloyl-ACP methyl ester carboxylesterase